MLLLRVGEGQQKQTNVDHHGVGFRTHLIHTHVNIIPCFVRSKQGSLGMGLILGYYCLVFFQIYQAKILSPVLIVCVHFCKIV